MLLDCISGLFRRRPATPAWAREVVAAIPVDELPSSIRTFAEQATRTRDPQRRALQMAKLFAATERVETILANDGQPFGAVRAAQRELLEAGP